VNRVLDPFPSSPANLPGARPPENVELAPGDVFDLRIAPVAKRLGDLTVRMLAYNGSIPGPTLWVRQGSHVVVNAFNDGDLETTVHWHGLRLENRFDGTAETQAPIRVGGRFAYRLDFPDPGVYWYHPHIREDYGQELGLYGNVVVMPTDADCWAPVDRELTLVLDDILLDADAVAPFDRHEPTHVAMGRFGNVLLANGEPHLSLTARPGEVVRLYLTNTANTRVFNVGIPGARMKRVGGDSGHYEREEFVEGVILAPSERAVVDVLFDEEGELTLEHRTPDRTYPLATIKVGGRAAGGSAASGLEPLRTYEDMVAERARVTRYLDAKPDKTLALVAEMNMASPHVDPGGSIAYTCPMHPEVIDLEPGRCPRCGMKLVATAAAPLAYACPMHPDVLGEETDRCPRCGMRLVPAPLVRQATAGSDSHPPSGDGHVHDSGGIEWEDDMIAVNRITTPANTRWKLIDRATGLEGAAIDWRFRVGDRVKLRLVNEMDSDHPMHHPFHVHGAGRFLILARDGVAEPNLVWKDTVLVPTGQVVDLLLEVTNPGRWMAHCHIAEHHEGGMMLNFDVDP
jgi:FtsP/CotA-like multicopper oxidase with cupredoxin domain